MIPERRIVPIERKTLSVEINKIQSYTDRGTNPVKRLIKPHLEDDHQKYIMVDPRMFTGSDVLNGINKLDLASRMFVISNILKPSDKVRKGLSEMNLGPFALVNTFIYEMGSRMYCTSDYYAFHSIQTVLCSKYISSYVDLIMTVKKSYTTRMEDIRDLIYLLQDKLEHLNEQDKPLAVSYIKRHLDL